MKKELLNKLQSTNFDEIVKHPQHTNGNINVNRLLQHINVFNKYVMAYGSSRTTQRNIIFNMINYIGIPSLFFTLNLAFVHCPLIDVLIGQDINLDVSYDNNILNKNERCKQTIINPKAQAIFVHTIVNVIFKYMI
jgi:hypothetical protein